MAWLAIFAWLMISSVLGGVTNWGFSKSSKISHPQHMIYLQKTWRESLLFKDPVGRLSHWGYQHIIKPTGKAFQVLYWSKKYTVLPLKYLDEIKNVERELLDPVEANTDNAYMRYWHKDIFVSGHMANIVKFGLNRHLGNIKTIKGFFEYANDVTEEATDVAMHEALESLPAYFETNNESKTISLFDVVNSLAVKTLTRLTLGKELCEDRNFAGRLANYFLTCFGMSFVLSHFNWETLQNCLSKPFIWLQWNNRRHLATEVSRRLEQCREQSLVPSGQRAPLDLVEMTVRYADRHKAQTQEDIDLQSASQELIHAIMAGTSGLVNFTVQMAYQILLEPQYLEPLRQEAEEAIRLHGWTPRMLRSLPLQDSFFREITRFYPMFTLHCNRIVKKMPIVFSDGFELPVGTRIAFPVGPSRHDPTVFGFDDADTFDGFRWARKAKAERMSGRTGVSSVATAVGVENLTFGMNPHACPGRFIATRICKTIFTKIILDYDMSWDRGTLDLPPKMECQGISVPNPFQKITFTARKSSQ